MTVRDSNQVLFDVVQANTKQNVGWELYVYDRDNPNTLLTIIPRYQKFSFSKVMSDTGAGTIELDMDDTAVFYSQDIQDYVINDENIIRFVKDGASRFAMLNEDEEDEFVNDSETKPSKITGRGAAALLEWATVLPPSYPTFTALPWTWAGKPALKAWLDLKSAADSRGSPCAAVVPSFTDTNDSFGTLWGDSNNMELKPGGDLLSLLRRFSEAGSADWEVRPDDLSLDVRQNFGFDRSNVVRFYVAADQLTSKKVKTRRGITNVVYTVSANNQIPFVQDPVSVTKWGRREVLAEVANAQDSTTAQSFGNIILATNKDEILSATFKVLPDGPGREVFVDYDIGDWIYLESDEVGLFGSYQVLAIGVEVDEEGNESIELTVQSTLQVRLVQLQKQFERETGASMRVNTELQIGNSGSSGGGVAGLTKFSKSNIALGTLGALPTYTWYVITDVPKRALLWRLKLTSGGSINWGFRITSQPNGAGELMFEAIGIGATEYNCSWPWVYENQDDPPTSQLYIGVRNITGSPSLFTIVDMRGESLAVN